MMSTTTAIMLIDRSFLFVMRRVPSYVGAFTLQYGILLAEVRSKGTIDCMIAHGYLPKYSR